MLKVYFVNTMSYVCRRGIYKWHLDAFAVHITQIFTNICCWSDGGEKPACRVQISINGLGYNNPNMG